MDKLLVMIPSRERPKILANFLESYYKNTSKNTELVVYVGEDDPCLPEYKKLKCFISTGKPMYLAEAYNYIWQTYKDEFRWFSPLNDDHYIISDSWDLKLIDIINKEGKGWGLVAAEDGWTQWNKFQHPSGCIISGNIPLTLKYFIWPKIQHIGVDAFFMHLMQGINRLYHSTEIKIEHRHWVSGQAFLDKNYRFVYSVQQYKYGMNCVEEYKQTQLKKDIIKLKEAIRK